MTSTPSANVSVQSTAVWLSARAPAAQLWRSNQRTEAQLRRSNPRTDHRGPTVQLRRSNPRNDPLAEPTVLRSESCLRCGSSQSAAALIGQPSALIGQPSALIGQPSALMGQLSALIGQLSALIGQPSALIGQLSDLLGRLSAPIGQPSALIGQPSVLIGQSSALIGQPSALLGQLSALLGQPFFAIAEKPTGAEISPLHDACSAPVRLCISLPNLPYAGAPPPQTACLSHPSSSRGRPGRHYSPVCSDSNGTTAAFRVSSQPQLLETPAQQRPSVCLPPVV